MPTRILFIMTLLGVTGFLKNEMVLLESVDRSPPSNESCPVSKRLLAETCSLGHRVIVTGGFNMKYINWESYTTSHSQNHHLSHDVASGSDITLCNKIDKPLVVYRFSGNGMTSNITLRKRWQNLDVFTPKMRFLINFHVM